MINLDKDDFVDIWLTSIHGHSRIKGAGSTPIILVGTHTDQLSPVSIDVIDKSRYKWFC